MTVCEHENLTGRGLDNCAEASVTVSSDARVRMWRLQRFALNWRTKRKPEPIIKRAHLFDRHVKERGNS